MDRSVNTKTDKINKMKPSVWTFEWDCQMIFHTHSEYTTRPRRAVPCIPLFCTQSIIQNCRLMQLIWFLNKAPEAVKWWKQKDRAVMVDQLMNLVLSCNTEEKLSCVFLRITKSHIQLIQVQLFSFFLWVQGLLKAHKTEDKWEYICVCMWIIITYSKNATIYCCLLAFTVLK